jgi:hypothetical protein
MINNFFSSDLCVQSSFQRIMQWSEEICVHDSWDWDGCFHLSESMMMTSRSQESLDMANSNSSSHWALHWFWMILVRYWWNKAQSPSCLRGSRICMNSRIVSRQSASFTKRCIQHALACLREFPECVREAVWGERKHKAGYSTFDPGYATHLLLAHFYNRIRITWCHRFHLWHILNTSACNFYVPWRAHDANLCLNLFRSKKCPN